MLFDHVDLRVASLARVRPLYDALLPAMGYGRIAADAESICYYPATTAPHRSSAWTKIRGTARTGRESPFAA